MDATDCSSWLVIFSFNGFLSLIFSMDEYRDLHFGALQQFDVKNDEIRDPMGRNFRKKISPEISIQGWWIDKANDLGAAYFGSTR